MNRGRKKRKYILKKVTTLDSKINYYSMTKKGPFTCVILIVRIICFQCIHLGINEVLRHSN